MRLAKPIALALVAILSLTYVQAQEDDPILRYSPAAQNLLKFNRFLINPTFSTVQENKSYINLLHRNQSVQFQDNDQTYFLSYSGRVGDRSGLGLSAYTQKLGPISNIGILANYAYGVKLSAKSNFTFGANLAYYSTGLDRNSVDVINSDDFRLNGTEDSSVLSFQPGFNISYGQFDFGLFAENLFDYNLRTSESLTDFSDKTYSGHLQYTYQFENGSGIMEGSRLMPMARLRMNGQNRFASNADDPQDISYGGSVILDLPKLGWLQGGYDSFYGASAGAGFNITKRLSLGYTMEKGFVTDFGNLGVTHEISFAYSFTPNLTEDRVMLEEDHEDTLVDTEDSATDPFDPAAQEENAELKGKLAENDAIIQEIMFREDSLENHRQKDLERRFNMVMSMVRNETNGKRPDLEHRAEQLFLGQQERPAVASGPDQNSPANSLNENSNITKGTEDAQDNVLRRIEVDAFVETAKRNNIKGRRFQNLAGVDNGYYLIANVYKERKYLTAFVNQLNNKGLSARYIHNPQTGLKYVYLEHYATWREALSAYKTGMNGTYTGELWIMKVDNRYTNEAYDNTIDKLKEKSAKYGTNVLQKNVIVRDQIHVIAPNTNNYNIAGKDFGYYIIANVFANSENATRFVKLLNSYGLSAGYFVNPENNWRYVYLKKHASWNKALMSYYTNLNDSYTDKIWIMRVRPNLLA